MGRASNRKWAQRVKRVLELSVSTLPANHAEANRLLNLFGAVPVFRRATVAFSQALRRRR